MYVRIKLRDVLDILMEIEVDGEYVVDNNHLVAFEDTLEYHINKISGYKSLFFH